MRQRADLVLVARGFFASRARAQAAIAAGLVRVDGAPLAKASDAIAFDAAIEARPVHRWASRGGLKLEAALEAFRLDPSGLVCLDVGASTGGFTDVLLVRGARSVVALDVGYGQLAWKLRQDARVRVVERTNFRLLGDDAFPAGFDLIVVDASFISLRTIVARAIGYLRAGGTMIALVKPQFEAGRARLGSGGVVRDPAVHVAVLREVRAALEALGVHAVNACASPLRGPAGNVEFFFRVARDGAPVDDARLEQLVAEVNPA